MTMSGLTSGPTRRKSNANVKVVVRLRPANHVENDERYRTVTHAISDHMLVFDPKVQTGTQLLQAKPRDVSRHRFRDLKYAFDYVFSAASTNRDVFEHTTKGIVTGVLNGYNCSVFAYGATGAGKTHTMLGNDTEPGVIYFTMMDLYQRIDEHKDDKIFDVSVSYSEVYNEQVRDLLIPRENLPIREDKTVGVIIAGLSLHKPKTADELLHMLQFGNKNRTQHPTDANAESSRSHAVFQVFVNQRDKTSTGKAEVVMAKMCLVDLAGSERAHTSRNCGARFREGANINRSLLALGNVINALADNKFKGHIPYRDSKLTRLLKDSLGGNCRTVMIAAVSPSSRSFEDTYNTLRYADRAKHIRADIKKNVMNVDLHIANYKKYVEELEKQNQELRKTKEQLLECLDKGENGSAHAISPIMRQFQVRLKDLFKVRKEIRKTQMEAEEGKRELKWKVSRREHAIKRVQRLTTSSTVLIKHGRVIDKMKKRIDKEEQALKHSAQQLQEQDNAICEAIADFTATQGRLIPEFLDVNARALIAESNLYDSDMYLMFMKKMARAQERQANVTESLVQCLLELVKKQHDVLHSQDLLSPELQHKYDECCYLVEERGVAFSQLAGGDGGLSPSPHKLATADPIDREANHCNFSDIIDINLPKLRVQGLVQTISQSRPMMQPQRVLKPGTGVKLGSKVTASQVQEKSAQESSGHIPLVSQATFSIGPTHNVRQGTTLGSNNGINQNNTHHQFATCSVSSPTSLNRRPFFHQSPAARSPSSPAKRESQQPSIQCDKDNSPSSPEANTSTDNMNNTFQVSQPALPNTPCIDADKGLEPRSKASHKTQPLDFQSAFVAALKKTSHQIVGKALMGEGDGSHDHCDANPRLAHNKGQTGSTKWSQQLSPSMNQCGSSPIHRPGGIGGYNRKHQINYVNTNTNSLSDNLSSPKSYAQIVKQQSPKVCQQVTSSPSSSSNINTPQRVISTPQRVTTTLNTPQRVPVCVTSTLNTPQRVPVCVTSPHNTPQRVPVTINTPQHVTSTFKLPQRVLSTTKISQGVKIDHFKLPVPARKALGSIDLNAEQKSPRLPVDIKISSKDSLFDNKTKSIKDIVEPAKEPVTDSLQLKAQPQRIRGRKHYRSQVSSNPYTTRNPHRHQRWKTDKGSTEASQDKCSGNQGDRPSYMQPTFARTQKMMSAENVPRQPQRQLVGISQSIETAQPQRQLVGSSQSTETAQAQRLLVQPRRETFNKHRFITR